MINVAIKYVLPVVLEPVITIVIFWSQSVHIIVKPCATKLIEIKMNCFEVGGIIRFAGVAYLVQKS